MQQSPKLGRLVGSNEFRISSSRLIWKQPTWRITRNRCWIICRVPSRRRTWAIDRDFNRRIDRGNNRVIGRSSTRYIPRDNRWVIARISRRRIHRQIGRWTCWYISWNFCREVTWNNNKTTGRSIEWMVPREMAWTIPSAETWKSERSSMRWISRHNPWGITRWFGRRMSRWIPSDEFQHPPFWYDVFQVGDSVGE